MIGKKKIWLKVTPLNMQVDISSSLNGINDISAAFASAMGVHSILHQFGTKTHGGGFGEFDQTNFYIYGVLKNAVTPTGRSSSLPAGSEYKLSNEGGGVIFSYMSQADRDAMVDFVDKVVDAETREKTWQDYWVPRLTELGYTSSQLASSDWDDNKIINATTEKYLVRI